jgi:NADPH:quinone reductase-like Zn-dependent oxidoreductase
MSAGMKAVEIPKFGLENLALVERPEPTPLPGTIAIRVRAASLNYRDVLMARGQYNPKQKLPLVPASDGAGEVVAIGAGVTRFKVGDRVAATFLQDYPSPPVPRDARYLKSTLGGPLDGMLAERVVVSEQGAVHVPSHLTDVEASTLPCAALTAWSALVTYGQVHAGDTVVVQGTGGVSIFALQLAKALGARVIATSSSDAKLDRVKSLGADAVVNYTTTPEWSASVKQLTEGIGADHIVDVAGAATLGQSIRAIRPGGTISIIGMLGGGKVEIDATAILMRGIRLQGVFVGSRAEFADMNRAIAQHAIKPVIDRVFPLAEARAAFEHMAAQKHFGKVVINID